MNAMPRLTLLERRAAALLATTAPLTSRQVARGLGIEGSYACIVLRGLRQAGLSERVAPSRAQQHASGRGHTPQAHRLTALGLFWTPCPTAVHRGRGYLLARENALRASGPRPLNGLRLGRVA